MKSFSFYFFKLTVLTLTFAGVFPEKKLVTNPIGIFFIYKVWPMIIVVVWLPLIPAVVLKMLQFREVRDWDGLLDITHVFFLGLFTLYIIIVLQITSANYQNVIKILEAEFRTNDRIFLKEFYVTLVVWAGIPVCALLFIGGNIYYKDMMAPLWIPFIDNYGEVSTEVFFGTWAYESVFAFYIFIMLTVWCPFIMVSTVCICKELDCLKGAVNWYGATYFVDYIQEQEDQLITENYNTTQFNDVLSNGPDMLRFVRKIVNHHLTIIR